MKTFGNKLRELRIALDLSQQQVADSIEGMSQTYLSALERRALAPRQEVLDMLNGFYRVENTYWFDYIVPSEYETKVIDFMRSGEYGKAVEVIHLLEQLDNLTAGTDQCVKE
jgi:transcriptional regulator with XRE-family HTH domain